MLQALHGVDPDSAITVEVPAAAMRADPPPIRAGPGLASLLAQEGPAPGIPVESGVPPPHAAVVAPQAMPPADVRWLAHLIAHGDAG